MISWGCDRITRSVTGGVTFCNRGGYGVLVATVRCGEQSMIVGVVCRVVAERRCVRGGSGRVLGIGRG